MNAPPVHRLPAPLEAAAQRIKQAARQAVERSIESLGLAALSAGSVAQRSEILAAQFEMDRKSAMFILSFDEAFEKRLRHDCAPRSLRESKETNWSELSLVEDHELEIKVAAERFGLQMAHACEWELRELDGYLGTVLEHGRFEAEHNPLRPELIGLAMIRAAEATSDREDSRRVVVAELARSLGDTLGPTYASIVADLRNMGIKPAGLTVRVTEGRNDGRHFQSGVDNFGAGHAREAEHGRGAAGSGSFAHSGPGSVHGSQPSVSGARSHSGTGGQRSSRGTLLGQVDMGMMNLIRRLAVGDGMSASAGGFDDSGSVGAMYRSHSGGPVGSYGSAVAPNLIRVHREELRAASTGAIDHMVIDVIGSLFDQILSDPKVPPQMARQIARLQLPVLRTALGDPTFFSSRRHPVRRFVNRIASVGSALEGFEDERGQRFLAKVRELVQEVVQGDFEQIETYETKLAELEAFVAEEARDEVATQGDVAGLLQAREDQLRLQGLYAQQLSGALQELTAPEFLRDFVSQIWSQVLLKAASASGSDSEQVKRLRLAARELFMSVQPKASATQRKEFLAALPKLMQSLNAGMDLVLWPDAERRAFFAQLLPAHAEALKNSGARTLDYNLLAKRVESVLERRLPSREDLLTAPLQPLPAQTEAALLAPFDAEEARRVGLVTEASVDWNGKVDIDLSDEPDLSEVDVHIEGMPVPTEALEPTRGKSLADHVQIGFAYQMHLHGQWEKVRLAHVSPARTFYVFRHGTKQREAVSLTHRMLVRLCDSGRMRAFESAYLLERATARARRQLASLGARAGA